MIYSQGCRLKGVQSFIVDISCGLFNLSVILNRDEIQPYIRIVVEYALDSLP